jgi:CelD/BcsL family acetyltransferase involved in cellulose biosynthesis
LTHAVGPPCAEDSSPCVVVSDLAQAEGWRTAWADLGRRSFRNELTQSPDWLLTWWRVYGPHQGRRLRLGLFHEAGRLIGLAPLLWRRHFYRGVLPIRRLELLSSGEPVKEGIYANHLSVLAERGMESVVAQRLAQAITQGAFGSWDEVVLPMMSGDTPLPGLLVDAFRSAGNRAELKETARAPYISLPATWEEYLRGLGANSRRNIQRSLRAFDAWSGGTTRLESVRDVDDLAKGKDILVRLHQTRWALGGGPTGVFRAPLYLEFHDAIMKLLAGRGDLELLWLCARDEPVAVLYGMHWADKVISYQTGRRTDLPPNVRPGAVLLALAIRRAIEARRREFDLQADTAFYKLQLTSQARPLVQVRAARNSVAELIRQAAKQCLGGLQAIEKLRGHKREAEKKMPERGVDSYQ